MASEPTAPSARFAPKTVPTRYPLCNRSAFSAIAVAHLERTTPSGSHIEQFANAVIDPDTGRSLSYEELIKDPRTRKLWSTSMTKELARLGHGLDNLTVGTHTVHYMSHDEIRHIPADRTVTYARIVVDYRPQKEDPNRVRLTVGGNLIKYPGEVTTRTAEMVTNKILWNSVLSTPNARYMCADVKNFYLETPMDRYEYMRLAARLVPDEFLDAYQLHDRIKGGYLYMEIRKGMYGLPQAGIIANQLLRKRLAPHGYYEVAHTPGLWKHKTRPIQFSLVVDDFGIKYEGKAHAEHLLQCLRNDYTIEVDWTGGLYCGITLDWHYDATNRYLDVSMPNYVKSKLHEFTHPHPRRPQHSPYPIAPKKYGIAAQEATPPDESPPLDKDGQKRVQQIVGSFLYYGRAVDITILKALNSLSCQQSAPTQETMRRVNHLLDYLATHPVAVIRYYPSDMLLQIHSDASYQNEPKAKSTAGGHYFLGNPLNDRAPIFLNGAIHTLCTILRLTAASAAEAELGALFLNGQEAKIIRLILEEMGHPQPPTPLHCDNSTAVGICNNTVKRQRSRSMETRYFWTVDQVAEGHLQVIWYPGAENLSDYVTKHHPTTHHVRVRPLYQHEQHSPRVLPRAVAPSVMRGCVKSTSGSPPTSGSPLQTVHATRRLCEALLSKQSHNLVRT